MGYGDQIKRARKRQQLTQNELATRARLCPSMISKIESSDPVRLDSLRRVLGALQIPVILFPPNFSA